MRLHSTVSHSTRLEERAAQQHSVPYADTHLQALGKSQALAQLDREVLGSWGASKSTPEGEAVADEHGGGGGGDIAWRVQRQETI